MRRALLLLLLCVPAFFLFLGSPAITDSDEAFYAEASREMIESGDWITPRFNYELRFQKPILYYWLAAASYAVAGVGEGTARFGAAMSGVGLVFVAYLCARRWIGDDAGFIAGMVTATSFATAMMARQALPDLPLAFFISLAVWSAFEALSGAERSAGLTPRRWLMLSGAACALAVLAKGPIGLALPVLCVLPPVAWGYFHARPRPRPPVSFQDLAFAAVLFLVIAVPWYAAATWVHGEGYLYRFFVGENLERFTTPRYNDPRPIWFYVPIVIGGLLPWTPFALAWTRRAAAPGTLLRLAPWAVVPLVVFSVSVGKQPRYILPCLVPLAILIGMAISTRMSAARHGRRDMALTIAGLISGAALLIVGLFLYRAGPLVSAAGGGSTSVWAFVVGGLAVAVLIAALEASHRFLPGSLAAAASIALVALQATVMTTAGPAPVVRVAEAIRQSRTPDTEVCACGAFLRNLPFYVRGRTIGAGTQEEVNAALASDRPMIAAIDEQKLVEAEKALGRGFERLFETTYLNTALLRFDDFIRPDASRTLQRIVVIRTR